MLAVRAVLPTFCKGQRRVLLCIGWKRRSSSWDCGLFCLFLTSSHRLLLLDQEPFPTKTPRMGKLMGFDVTLERHAEDCAHRNGE